MTRTHRWGAIGVAAGTLLLAAATPNDAPAPAGPVRFNRIVGSKPAQRVSVARIDLSAPGVQVVIAPAGADPDGPGPWETTLDLPSVVARTLDLEVAVNGGYFDHDQQNPTVKYAVGDPARAANLVMSGGEVISHRRTGVVLSIGPNNRAAITPAEALPSDAKQAIGGSLLLVRDGKNVAPDDGRHPRTAAGLSADGKTLLLIVVDGKRPGWAEGMTLKELADACIAQGCASAINLDGGGSSAMVRHAGPGRWDVVNSPSDGAQFLVPLSVQRPVAYVFGVRVQTK